MNWLEILRIIRETLIVVLGITIFVVVILYLIWVIGMAADCTFLVDLRGAI